MEYLLFFLWMTIMSILIYFVLKAHKLLRKSMKSHE
jgi:hypothetical protein